MPAKSKRPYLIRALNDWIIDSELTPYLMVDASGDDIQVPQDYVSAGKIVLNIAPSAVRDLVLGDDAITFSARFAGKPFPVYVPVSQVIAIYARETSEGMMFEESEAGDSGDSPDDGPDKPGGHLKLVK